MNGRVIAKMRTLSGVTGKSVAARRECPAPIVRNCRKQTRLSYSQMGALFSVGARVTSRSQIVCGLEPCRLQVPWRTAAVGASLSLSLRSGNRSFHVKGFGCRPVVTYPRVLRAGVRKPPGKEPAVGGAGGGRLWRFDGGAARASGALSYGVGGGSTIATVGALPMLLSTG
jgi:hypothetical protein